MRTQRPPPLKACRPDSDLGHHSFIRDGSRWNVVRGMQCHLITTLLVLVNEKVTMPSKPISPSADATLSLSDDVIGGLALVVAFRNSKYLTYTRPVS
jgi:hypothetical protein